jgi:hypothetical protein
MTKKGREVSPGELFCKELISPWGGFRARVTGGGTFQFLAIGITTNSLPANSRRANPRLANSRLPVRDAMPHRESAQSRALLSLIERYVVTAQPCDSDAQGSEPRVR